MKELNLIITCMNILVCHKVTLKALELEGTVWAQTCTLHQRELRSVPKHVLVTLT